MILGSYKNIADALGEFLGSSCEIVIHSLESLDSSIIKIVNGNHSGRMVGAPITDIALSMLSKKKKTPLNLLLILPKTKEENKLNPLLLQFMGNTIKSLDYFVLMFF